MKDVPFYANHDDGMRCMLAAYRSIIDYFLHRKLSWAELEELTGYQPGRAVWTLKPLVDMLDMGFDIRMIEPFDYRRYLTEGESYLQELYTPEEVQWYYDNSNIRDIQPFIPRFLGRITYECRRPQLADIDTMLDGGRLVFVTVNSRILNDREGFSSHALLVTGRNGDSFVAHDSGGRSAAPQANRHITRAKLWEAMGGEHNTAEVTGFKLKPGQAGERLDSYVVSQKSTISRAFAAKLIDQGKVLVNGEPSKPGHKLRASDKVKIDYDEREQRQIPQIDLPVLYEDGDCVVISKPAGVLTHSKGAFNPEPTVATWLYQRISTSEHKSRHWKVEPSNEGNYGVISNRVGIVHRLDRATSGVMICAKNSEALSWLQKQFSQRKVKKTYVAIVAGKLQPAHAVIDMPIERNPKAPATFRVDANGKPATTEYEVEQTSPHFSLIKLMPQTGRTHQLRVHLKQLGHPIVGDTLYDGEVAERLFLHALSLEITLPNRERKIFTAPLPPEFEQKLDHDHA